jgi:XTP/dITP diphosphohydrolase
MITHRFVVLATKNRGKAVEFSALLPADIGVRTLVDLNLESPDESGVTFAENAAIKAATISEAVDTLVLADDSGLEVDALDGAPGVYSARYAGEPGDDERNIDLLLDRLSDVADPGRTARFVCQVAVARGGSILATAEGSCPGRIGHERRGSNGFGYDPVFVLADGRTMAELSTEEKNQISHRAEAFRNVADRLIELVYD